MGEKWGFIGVGNMGSAMVKGLINSKTIQKENVFLWDKNEEKISIISKSHGCQTTTGVASLVQICDVIVVAVKPQDVPDVLKVIAPVLNSEKMVISIAAGVSLSVLEEHLDKDKKIIRAMPNTPALVGEAMSALCPNEKTTEEDLKIIRLGFEAFGRAEVVSENLIHSVIAVSGSAPAYGFLFLEALADGAVLEGMAREQAYIFAAQTLLGVGKMVLETHQHPGQLKDAVCSPGGTTIEAVRVLEKRGFRSAVLEAMVSCAQKSRDLSSN